MQTLSLSIIVGNEEKHIERFIRSFRPAINELCIVRSIGTLPPDNTIKIAIATAKELNLPISIGEYKNRTPLPHTDNFGAARQQSFNLAKSDFIMWADCDDLLDPDSIPKIKDLLENPGQSDHIFFWYKLSHNSGLFRERMFKKGIGKWHNPVHECYASQSHNRLLREDIIIIHSPIEKNHSQSFGRNLAIMQEAIKYPDHPEILWFYICRDSGLIGLKELSFNAGIKALEKNLGPIERYETHLLLFGLVSENPNLVENPIEFKKRILLDAIYISPERREAIGAMACLELETKKYEAALGWLQHMGGIPVPKIKPWTHRSGWYGHIYTNLLIKCYRLTGKNFEASEIENKIFENNNSFISICHATARGYEALKVKERLLNSAEFPLAIEYIFCVDEDDIKSQQELLGERVILNPKGTGPVSAWNIAAKASTGAVLIQMSDDWQLPPRWDQGIFDCTREALDKERVLLINDSNRKDILVTMAIVTRKYYEKYGYLFHPGFYSMYSDNELTARALKDNVLFDCRHYLKFLHDHPMFNPKNFDASGNFDETSMDPVYYKSNHKKNYEEGKKLFLELHPEQIDNRPTV